VARTRDRKRGIAIAFWLVLLPLEIGASILAYWTLGWSSTYDLLCICVLVNFFAFAALFFSFRAGVVLALGYGLLLVGYHTVLGIRWYYVDTEARRVVGWLHSEETKSGRVPEDLRWLRVRETRIQRVCLLS
jgi:hypothetical protein